ncbi:MAG: FAD-dependent oxidoreductase [Firmicutes bacterium]|nr:FAD-dependent oxidoreductase [Bacillota bacterium]
MEYVIIGNSAAAVGAVESIRKVDGSGSITVIGEEKEHVYSRPLIAHLAAGEVGEERLPYRPLDFYDRMSARARLGERVAAVDYRAQKVVLASGGTVYYDRLLLATGSRPVPPPVRGLELNGVTAFQTLADARQMLEMVRAGRKRALVLGAGLIGMRAAYALQKSGADVTVVARRRVLSRILDGEGSGVLEAVLEKGGVRLLKGCSVLEITGREGRVAGAVLDNGEFFPCDLVVTAVGVAPDLSLAGELKTNRGILVNEYFQTSFSNVYAAGDVAETWDIPRGRPRVNANWPNAHGQGRLAGLNMAGRAAPYKGSLGMNTVTFYGVPVVSMGIFDPVEEGLPGYEIKVRKNPPANIYQKLVFKDNRLKGAIFIGDLGYCGAVKDLIMEQTLVGIVKDAILEERYQFYDFLRKMRRDKVEGVHIQWPETYYPAQRYKKNFDEETWTERERNERPW